MAEVKRQRSLGLTGTAAIDTKDEFRAYIESLDLTTTAGQTAYVAAMNYADSILAVTDAIASGSSTKSDLILLFSNLGLNISKAVDLKPLTLNIGGGIGSLIDKIFGSLSSLATPAQIAATAIDGLAKAAGGLDKLSAITDKYFTNFYTAEEQKSVKASIANTKLIQWNETLGLTGAAAIDTRAEFRAYIESLNLTTEAGQAAYVAAMDYIDSIIAVSDALTSGQSTIQDFIGSQKGAGLSTSTLTDVPLNVGAVPKYAIGSDYIAADQHAVIHQGEMIFSASQAGSIRNSVVKAMQVMASPRTESGSNSSSLLAQITELLRENKLIRRTLEQMQSDNAGYGDAAISQRSETLTVLKKSATEATFAGRVGGYA
jgi:hypothetical protein